MGRKSTNPNKNIYQERREELGLSREAASEALGVIAPERIEKIENEKSNPHPDEILAMSEGYKMPELCNYYCANECAIGQKYVPEVKKQLLAHKKAYIQASSIQLISSCIEKVSCHRFSGNTWRNNEDC